MACVVITGASRGLGRSLAAEFAGGGHELVIAARDLGALEHMALDLTSRYGVVVHACGCDLAADDGPRTLVEFCAQRGLEIAVLVNNAAVFSRATAHTLQKSEIHELINLNVRAITELTLAFVPGMIERHQGTIINISSLASLAPANSSSLYSASKAYLSTFSESLDRDLRGTGVECVTVRLGPVRTAMISGTSETPGLPRWLRWVAMQPETAAAVIFDGFLGRRRRFSAGLFGALTTALLRILPPSLFRLAVARLT